MKALLAIFLVCIVPKIGATAIPDPTPAQRSPLLGSWTVDVSRLPIPPEARPRKVTITFASVDANDWTMRVDIVDADGHEIDATGAYTLDGKQVRVTGSPEADAGAVKMPSPDVLVLALSKGGAGASTRIYAAEPGGQNMVETAVYFGQDGKPIMRTNYFSRAQ